MLVGLPLHYGYLLYPDVVPQAAATLAVGDDISQYLGVAHGWLYMIFLVVAFMLSRKARWDLRFTLVTLVCGTVPILSFWAERRATARVRAEYPDPPACDSRRTTGRMRRTIPDGT